MDGPVNGAGAEPLLERVRRLFAGFMLLTLLVEVLEWIDADGSLWPQRYVAAGALLVAAAWTLWLYRRGAPHWLADATLLASIVGAAWGLDRAGAVLALLVGVATFRPVYGDSPRPTSSAPRTRRSSTTSWRRCWRASSRTFRRRGGWCGAATARAWDGFDPSAPSRRTPRGTPRPTR